jgi:glycyl-tRNA synthetase beta chain
LPEFLLEVGCEEIPASWLPSLAHQLGERLAEAAAHEHLPPEDVRALQAPRRLCVAAMVPARQPDREERVFGPAVRAAKDASGAWTPAALGFAKKAGVAPEALRRRWRAGPPRTCCPP